ncbi:pyridoxal phosphate-dependent aminotransferase [Alistipes indistinctus]|uniref:pyridoxal phosphate-dependent aminotransferase n=1 Tax=Alistipes indistinctus TaxID=626932 RepID=UPI003F0B62A6
MENKPIQIALAGRLSGVGEYYFSKKLREIDQMRAAGQDIISLGVGGPDQPPHPKVIARLAAESAKPGTHAYQPYKGTAILREAFARWYNRFYGVTLDPVTEVLPLIGSKEGIMHVCMTYLNPGDKVLIPNPGYPTYRSAATIAGGVCVDYLLREQNGWMPDFAEIERGGLDGVKIMIVNFPHMPTGAAPREGLFRDLVAFAREHNILLLHDNPYSFIRNEHPESLLATDGAKEVALELNSLSKSHSMAGWRIGMLAGAPERIDEVIRFKSNMDSGMFYPMQAAAAEALDLDEEWYRSLNAVYREREVKGFELLDLIGCSYAKPQSGLFVWGRLPEGAGDCFEFSDKLLYGCGVFITPGGIFGSEGNNYIRISLCSPVEVLERAKQRIREKM